MEPRITGRGFLWHRRPRLAVRRAYRQPSGVERTAGPHRNVGRHLLAVAVDRRPFHLSRSMQSKSRLHGAEREREHVQRDVSTNAVKTAFEGAIFAYRDGAWKPRPLSLRCMAVLPSSRSPDDSTVAGEQLFNPSNYQAPDSLTRKPAPDLRQPCLRRTSNNPCSNSFPTCRVPEHFRGC